MTETSPGNERCTAVHVHGHETPDAPARLSPRERCTRAPLPETYLGTVGRADNDALLVAAACGDVEGCDGKRGQDVRRPTDRRQLNGDGDVGDRKARAVVHSQFDADAVDGRAEDATLWWHRSKAVRRHRRPVG